MRKILPYLLFLFSCVSPKTNDIEIYTLEEETLPILDLAEIKERGYITAIVENSASGMFLYRGEPMGYEYELASKFAESLEVELKILTSKSLRESYTWLNEGLGDFIAQGLTITRKRKEFVNFSDPHYRIRQVLVQRKPKNWRMMKLHEIEKVLITSTLDLKGKEIHVKANTSYVTRLESLSNEIGSEIIIKEEVDSVETEYILEQVANGTIDYSVADENIAAISARNYPILDISTAVSFPQEVAWGLRKNSPDLLLSINEWIKNARKYNEYFAIYEKYFKSNYRTKDLLKSDYYSTSGDQFSPYDSLIQVYAEKVNWDWRLLAAQISKESRFNPIAKSWAGARGLMQVMPRTGKSYGVRKLYNPNKNLQAGTDHLLWLEQRWIDLPDSTEQIKFILGAYNVGNGHIRDAVKLTKKFGGDTTLWDGHVAKYLLLKSQKKYYQDPVVIYGYCRGNEPVEYVKDILYRYDRYQQLQPNEALEADEPLDSIIIAN
ncbi:MAG: transporter substrate-binding domain-containing protein [Reichenbachiella sp.]